MPEAKSAKLRASLPAAAIPAVDRLLRARALGPLLSRYGRTQVTARLRRHVPELRRPALAGRLESPSQHAAAIAGRSAAGLGASAPSSLRPVFKPPSTGLHTNLRRALLPEAAAAAVVRALTAPVKLEF